MRCRKMEIPMVIGPVQVWITRLAMVIIFKCHEPIAVSTFKKSGLMNVLFIYSNDQYIQ